MINFSQCRRSTRRDHRTAAVEDLTIEIPTGKITVFVGPSGCGKTTSLRMINRMIEPTVRHRADRRRRTPAASTRRSCAAGIGYVIQNAGLFPHRTVLDNIATVPVLQGRASKRPGPPRPSCWNGSGWTPTMGQPLPRAALRRPATTGRGGQGAGRRPAGDADGRAVLRGRPGGPRATAGRVHPAAGRAGQDDRVRHPRHRRGRQARRPDCRLRRRRPARPVRRARPRCSAARPTTSSPTSSAATAATARCRSPWPGDLPLHDGPTLRSARRCRAEPVAADADPATPYWVLVVDDERQPRGWARRPTSRPGHRVSVWDDLVLGGSLAGPESSLRTALDAALSSPSGRGVAVDADGRVIGTVAARTCWTPSSGPARRWYRRPIGRPSRR